MIENSPTPIFSTKYKVVEKTYRIFEVHKITEEDEEVYFVRFDGNSWKCSCIASSIFMRNCKHINFVKDFLVNKRSDFEI
jgi:hypothetical protein